MVKDLRLTKYNVLFVTDNGRTLCGRHLGASARFTGRDISGQRILEMTPEVLAYALAEYPDSPPCCEDCGFTSNERVSDDPRCAT